MLIKTIEERLIILKSMRISTRHLEKVYFFSLSQVENLYRLMREISSLS